ncbi:3498_t:CDS:1, partial [Cetraspora pellucida]
NDTYFPIRIKQKTEVILNSHNFIVTVVVGYSNNLSFPSYICQSNTFQTQTPVDNP